MKTDTRSTNTFDTTVSSLCYEINLLNDELDFYKNKCKELEEEVLLTLSERLKESKRGLGQAIMLALSVAESPDGSLSISKESRKVLAESLKISSD